MARQRSRGLSDRTRRGSAAFHSLLVASAFLAATLAEAGTPRPPQKAPPAQRDVTVQPVPLAGGPLYANSWAVVVGVNEFQSPKVSRLNYAVNDATSVAQALGFPSGNIIRLLNRQAIRSEIERGLSSVLRRRAGPQDRVVVFFATHGVTLPLPGGGEEGYLLPYDADPDDLPLTAFSMSQIKLIGQRLPAKHTLVAVDACYGGYSLVRSQAPPVLDKRCLDLISQSRGLQVLTAGRKDQPVIEEQGHGVFTRKLLDGLVGHADENRDGLITLAELGAWMHPRVAQASEYKQDMQWGSLDGDGQFVFVLPGTQMTPAPPTLPEPSVSVVPRVGSLLLRSPRESVEIWLGGRPLGKAGPTGDLLVENVPAGSHRLQAKAHREGFKPWEGEVQVLADRRAEVVINIEPLRYDTSRLRPSSERPTYTVGGKWMRSDGTYELIRVEKDRYIFVASSDREIHLTKDLLVTKMQKGGWSTEFDSLPTLSWPLKVGSWGTGMGNWQIPPDAPSDRRSLFVTYMWSVEAYEDIHVPAGTFKAFRIVLSWEPHARDVITTSNYPRRQLISWYAPEVRQLVKAEARGLGMLEFQITAVDPPKRTPPPQ